MVKNKNGIVRGDNCRFDVGDTRMTKKFIEALEVLDGQCDWGTWCVYREGRTWVAESCNGPFEPLEYKNGTWDRMWD